MTTNRVSSRYILSLLFALGTLSAAVILGTVFVLSHQINSTEQHRTQDLVQLFTQETRDALEYVVADFAHWTTAFVNVRDGDDAALYDNVGSATETELFDNVYILTADSEILFMFGEPHIDRDTLETLLSPIVAALAKTDPYDYASRTAEIPIGETLAVYSATQITPDEESLVPEDGLPIMIGTRLLDEARLGRIATYGNLDGIGTARSMPEDEQDFLALRDLDGRIAGYLTWQSPRTGTEVLMTVLPGILVTTLAIFAICLSAARYFHRQSEVLTHATRLARTDKLTGLLNRSGLEQVTQTDRFQTALDLGQVAAIFIDMDDFKTINDTLGHDAGDQALQVVAQWLNRSVRSSDHVARLGGDEFLCLISDASVENAARALIGRVQDHFADPTWLQGQRVALSASFGVAISQPGDSFETLLTRSDRAMYADKARAHFTTGSGTLAYA